MSDQQKPLKEESSPKEISIERVFLANDVLPDAAAALADRIDSIEDAIKTADVVLDTNVLLLPYGAGANSLKEIVTIFKNLKEKGRLFLPAQVAREFVRNRPNKLSELQQGIADKIGRYRFFLPPSILWTCKKHVNNMMLSHARNRECLPSFRNYFEVVTTSGVFRFVIKWQRVLKSASFFDI